MNPYDAPVMPWDEESVPSAEHLRRLDEAFHRAIDKAGGSFTLEKPIAIGTGGLTVGGCNISGKLEIDSASNGLLASTNGADKFTHTARSRTVRIPLAGAAMLGTWKARNGFPRAVSGAARMLTAILPQRHLLVGATISSAVLRFQIGQTHPVVPSVRIKLGMFRNDGAALLSTGSGYAMDATSALADYNTLQPRSLTYTANQNNVIANSNFYGIAILDESGSNSLPGNLFFWVDVTVSDITKLRT